MLPILELHLLGAPEFILDSVFLSGLHSQKTIALLAYLACNPGPQRREALADLLWDATSTAQSLSNLRTLLSRLRGALGDYLLITPQTIAIVPAVLVDVAALEEQMAAANHLSLDSASHLAQSLSLYRGDFLAGFHLSGAFGFEQWAILERERLRFLILQGYRRLVDYFLEQGECQSGIRAAAAWLRLDPLEEDAHGQMMRLLAEDGQQAAALTHYERCRHLLRAELDVEPSEELQSLHRQISAKKLPPLAPTAEKVPASAPIPHNLPPRLTSFVGRKGELDAVRSLFADPATRLVTLVGEGGVGKSSLAVAAGEEMLAAWADGVFLVSLVDVEAHPVPTLPHRLATEVAHAVGLTFSIARGAAEPATQLFSFLRERSLLLILDNFEHLNAGAPFVGDLLQAAPGCRALMTARQPLLIQGESALRLYGLPTPPDVAPSLSPATYASMDLFVQRARQREHTFSLTPANQAALGRLCRLLAGNALALELAAAWVEHFSLTEMTALLEADPLDFLRSSQPHLLERHRSLRRVMETSWGLLSADARQMLARISIFRGSFHRKAALAVAGGSLDLLAELVNCSLLQQSGPGRYELHELVRQFASERLAASADAGSQSAEGHARYYLSLVSSVERSVEMTAQVMEELANIRQAWEWAVAAKEMGALTQCSTGLRNFYLRKGLFQEAEEAFGRGIAMILAAAPDAQGRLRSLAALQVAQAVFLNIRGNYAKAICVAEEAIGYALPEKDEATTARGYLQWGTALYRQGGYADAVKHLTKALAAARNAGLAEDEADILRHLGVTWLEQGNFAAANAHCTQALVIYQQVGNQLGEGNTLNDLGWMNQRQQNFEEARTYLEAAQRIHAAIDNGHGTRMALLNLGIVQQMLGDFSQAHSTYQQLLADLDKLPDRYHH
jgi:predicted ATPase/DNA-binding SARP family transcriptional activator/Tfp pilus assembly protein PilF